MVAAVYPRDNKKRNKPITKKGSKFDQTNINQEDFGLCERFLIFISYIIFAFGFPFSLCCSLKVISIFTYKNY